MENVELRKKICEVGGWLYYNHLAIANDGNISVRISENEILITPTRVCKKDLVPEEIVHMNLQGEIISGEAIPSSEAKVHLKVFAMRPEVNVVIHTHSPYATAYATAGIPLDKVTVPSAYCFLGEVPVTEYGTASTQELPEGVGKLIKNHDVLLLKNHGTLVVGQDLVNTYFKCERLESYAQISLFAHLLGGACQLNEDERERLDIKKHNQQKMGLL